MNQVEHYMQTVCAQIKCQEVHDEIRMELQSHIEEMIADYIEAGYSEEEAIEKATWQMGDAELIGRQFNDIHKPRTEWGLLTAVASFLGLGAYAMYSLADSLVAPYVDYYQLIVGKLIAVLLGLATLALFYFFDYRKIKRHSGKLFAGTLILYLLVAILGTHVNGVPYLRLGILSIDFFSITPMLLLLALPGLLGKLDWQLRSTPWCAFALFAFPMLLFRVLGFVWFNAILYPIGYLLILYSSGVTRKQFLLKGLLPAGLFWTVGLVLHLLKEGELLWIRLQGFLHPYQHPLDSGYQIVQSLEAIKAAGWWGREQFYPLQQVPELHTDFIFTYLVYLLGWFAGLCILLLGTFLTVRLWRVAHQVRDRYGAMLATAVLTVFALQFYWNLLMVVGWVPMTGVSLPFFSYGGTNQVLQMALMGIALSVYRRKDMLASTTT